MCKAEIILTFVGVCWVVIRTLVWWRGPRLTLERDGSARIRHDHE